MSRQLGGAEQDEAVIFHTKDKRLLDTLPKLLTRAGKTSKVDTTNNTITVYENPGEIPAGG